MIVFQGAKERVKVLQFSPDGRGLGRVSRVAFRSDSKAVLVEAEPFEIDRE